MYVYVCMTHSNRPLGSVPLPDSTDGLCGVSEWGRRAFPCHAVKRVSPMLLPYIRPCEVGAFLNIASLSNAQLKALVGCYPRLAYRLDAFRESMLTGRPEKMYRHAEARTPNRAIPFDYARRNATAFAGLENSLPNSYINPMLQVLYFAPVLRGAVRAHLCTRDYCLACELAFLFHMLDSARPGTGTTFSARNFVRAFRQIPQALVLSIVEQAGATSHLELPTLFTNFATFLFGHLDTEMATPAPTTTARGAPSARPVAVRHPCRAVARECTMRRHTLSRCPSCASVWEHDSESMLLDLVVPVVVPSSSSSSSSSPSTAYTSSGSGSGNCGRLGVVTTDVVEAGALPGGALDFATILERNLHRVHFSKAWCDGCKHMQQIEQHKDVRTLPHSLLITVSAVKESSPWPDAAAAAAPAPVPPTDADDAAAVVSPWLPLTLTVALDAHTGEPHVIGAAGTTTATTASSSEAAAAASTTVVYELTAVVSHVLDPDPRAPTAGNLVAHVRVPPAAAHAHGSDASSGRWYLFNDFQVTATSAAEAVRFPSWKRPCFIVYTQKQQQQQSQQSQSQSQQQEQQEQQSQQSGEDDMGANAYDAQTDKQTDCTLFLSPFLLNQKRGVRRIAFQREAQLPQRGEAVAIDSEFVSLSACGTVCELDGTHAAAGAGGAGAEAAAAHRSVARVTCVFGQGEAAGRTLVDDYVFIPEPVVDYLTRFSGVTPRDLDPAASTRRLVPFKDVYLKLRYLVDRGCVFVGHGLANDFRVIGIHVPRDQVVDTVELFHRDRQRLISLRFLTALFVEQTIQQDVHSSSEDAKSVCGPLLVPTLSCVCVCPFSHWLVVFTVAGTVRGVQATAEARARGQGHRRGLRDRAPVQLGGPRAARAPPPPVVPHQGRPSRPPLCLPVMSLVPHPHKSQVATHIVVVVVVVFVVVVVVASSSCSSSSSSPSSQTLMTTLPARPGSMRRAKARAQSASGKTLSTGARRCACSARSWRRSSGRRPATARSRLGHSQWYGGCASAARHAVRSEKRHSCGSASRVHAPSATATNGPRAASASTHRLCAYACRSPAQSTTASTRRAHAASTRHHAPSPSSSSSARTSSAPSARTRAACARGHTATATAPPRPPLHSCTSCTASRPTALLLPSTSTRPRPPPPLLLPLRARCTAWSAVVPARGSAAAATNEWLSGLRAA